VFFNFPRLWHTAQDIVKLWFKLVVVGEHRKRMTETLGTLLVMAGLLLVAWLPGAVLFHLPLWHRDRRAALDADERLFWHVVLSVSWSLTMVLVLAALERYQFRTLVWCNAGLAAGGVVLFRGGLRAAAARRSGGRRSCSLVLGALAAWRFVPVSEHVIGGKTRASTSTKASRSRSAADWRSRPCDRGRARLRADLFFPSEHKAGMHSAGFMGFFIQIRRRASWWANSRTSVPASIAIGLWVRRPHRRAPGRGVVASSACLPKLPARAWSAPRRRHSRWPPC
jgi:hypothetical protein